MNVAWIVTHGSAFDDNIGDVVFAETRGKARADAVRSWGCDFDDPGLCVRREKRLDAYEGKRIPDWLLRDCGFTDEDGRTCNTCGLGDPSCGYGDSGWRVCRECWECGECGCVCEEDAALCAGENASL